MSGRTAREYANIVVPAVIEQDRVWTAAEGKKPQNVLAGATRGRMAVLTRRVVGFQEITAVAGSDPDLVVRRRIVAKRDVIARIQAGAISHFDFVKVVVYDGGQDDTGGNFLHGLTQALPSCPEVAKRAGSQLPEYLGALSWDDATEDSQTLTDDDQIARPDEAA